MSLFGALSLGSSSLAAEQAALQVTGNNISNSGSAGYTREAADIQPNGSQQLGTGTSTGAGVTLASVTRQVNEALNENLRNSTSDQNSAQSLNTSLTSLQNAFGALDDNNLSTQLNAFFNAFSSLANNPTDATQRSQVIQDGTTIASSLQTLRSQVTALQQNTNQQVGTLAKQANSLVQGIADLNKQISSQGTNAANNLHDQRDQDLADLSKLINIHAVDQGNGSVNVLVGSTPLIQGSVARGITTAQTTDASGNVSTTLAFADNGDALNATSGQIGGLVNASQNYISPALSTVDSIAGGLISAVNSIYSQGQGVAGFSNVTSTSAVASPAVALNAGKPITGLTFSPTNGTFDLNLTNSAGQVTTKQISVNLSGTGTQTTLNSLASSITTAGGGVVSATVNSDGTLSISSNNSGTTFNFGNDNSGVLASLGINTFFSGTDASNIAVNSTLQKNSDLLATGRENIAGSNANAQALALAGAAAVPLLGGKSVSDTYADYIGNLAVKAQTASNNVTAQTTITSTLSAQQQSISGVSLDEETVNMMKFQQAFQGSARFINVVNQLMQTVLGLVQ